MFFTGLIWHKVAHVHVHNHKNSNVNMCMCATLQQSLSHKYNDQTSTCCMSLQIRAHHHIDVYTDINYP